MSERAEALADDFAAANADAIAFVRGCTDHDWAVLVPAEEWPVRVVLHHIAEGHALGVRWLAGMVSGVGVRDTAEGIDRTNAAHAARAGRVTRAETVVLLEENGECLFQALLALNDEDLDRSAPFGPAGGQSLPTAALAAVTARHTREHLAHARAAAGDPAAADP